MMREDDDFTALCKEPPTVADIVTLSDACEDLGIRLVIGFDRYGTPVPSEIAQQLHGSVFQWGMEVSYRGQRWAVIGIDIKGGIKAGDTVPEGCEFEMLDLTPARFISRE